MPSKKPKIIVIMGPTASGKSGVAIELAKKFGGEIISADSRQIYKGLDIGSGKVKRDAFEDKIQDTRYNNQTNFNIQKTKSKIQNTKKTKAFYSEGVIHHLIDVAKPGEDFNVSHFKKLTEEKIQEILSRKKVPIICGGTAFWIDTLTKNSDIPEVVPNEKLRAKLALKSTEQLFTQLKKLDPVRASNIDSQNKVRLIRAIEICKVLGKVPELHEAWNVEHGTSITKNEMQNTCLQDIQVKYNFLQIGIEVPREILNAKIKKRLEERFKEGMLEEVANLHKKGVSWKWLERIGLEYRWLSLFLRQKVSESQMHEKLYFASIHYAKRQMTWLKRNPQIKWHSDYKKIEKEVQAFLK
jgi:tRNA dimethylallyltransferase